MEIVNAKLFIEEKPIKIHLDGFTIAETLDLQDIIEERGGEISPYPGRGVVTLSPANYCTGLEGHRYDVDWLNDSISANAVQNITKYRLQFPETITIHEAEEVDYNSIEPMNVTSQQGNDATDCHIVKEDTLKITEVRSLSQTHASTDENGNDVPEDSANTRRKSARIRGFDQKPDYKNCDSSEENESSKKKRYSKKKQDTMMKHLKKYDVVDLVAGPKIGERLHEEQKHGEEVTRQRGHDVVPLSPPEHCSKVQANRYIVEWLHKSIAPSAVENLLDYTLESPSPDGIYEVDEKDHHAPDTINQKIEDTVACCNSLADQMKRISEDFPPPRINASPDIDKITVSEDAAMIRRESDRKRRFCQDPNDNNVDVPETKKSSKRQNSLYTDEEDTIVMHRVIDNEAIDTAGGPAIWKQKQKEEMMRNE